MVLNQQQGQGSQTYFDENIAPKSFLFHSSYFIADNKILIWRYFMLENAEKFSSTLFLSCYLPTY